LHFGETIWAGNKFSWLAASRQLIEQVNRGNHYAMLEAILDALEQRNKTAIARTDWNAATHIAARHRRLNNSPRL